MNIPAEPPAAELTTAELTTAELTTAELTTAEPPAAEPLPPSDAELIVASRSGDTTAYATLYRRHVAAAHGLARQLVRGQAEADDVVAETFAKVLDLLRRGGGPDGAFRPYLLTAVRRAAYDRHRAERRQVVTDEMEAFDPGVPFADPAVAGLERSMIARAFASLPERWQAVLWHTEIEGARPAEVAALLGLTANGVAALAYRAREGLRQAYLQMHLSGVARTECRPVAARLGAYVRGGLAKRDSAEVTVHLDQCADCRAVLAELGDVNVALRSIVAPLVLGPAAAGYLASAAAKGSAGGWVAGRLAWFRHAPKGQQAAAAGVAVAAVAGLATMAMALTAHTSPAAGGAPAHPPQPPAAAGAPPASAPPASTPPASAASGTSGSSVGRTSGYGCGTVHKSVCRVPHPYVPSPSQPSAASHRTGASSQSAHHQSAPSLPPSSPATATPVSATSAPATSRSSSSVAAPGLAPAQYAQLTTQIDPVGTLPRGAIGIVSFTVTDPSAAAALRVKADVTLPAGVSYLAAGALGMDTAAVTAPGGWTCIPVPSGATCTHGPLAAGTSTTSYLQVAVAADAPAGTPPAISVGDGGRLVWARGTAGVSAGGFPAQFAASGRYAVVTAGASLAGRATGRTGDRCESGTATWSPARLFSGPRCPAGATGATLALPGRVVWAGLYWAWAAGPSHAAVELRGPGGNYQQVTGTAMPGTVTLGPHGLAEIPVHQAFAEVTGLVARYGTGAWTAATVPFPGSRPLPGSGPFSGSGWDSGSGLGSGGWAEGAWRQGAWPAGTDARYLGWTLVVVAADGAAPAGQVMVLDGVRQVDSADPYFSASLGGQAAGRAVSAKVVAWTADGPEAAAYTRPRAGGGAAVSLTAGAVPYLVGVIAATDSR